MTRKDTQFFPSLPATSALYGSLLLSLRSPNHFFLFLPSWHDLLLNNPFMSPAAPSLLISKALWSAFQVALVIKNPPANAGDVGDPGSIPGSGRSPGEGNGKPLQYSCLKNPMDRGVWRATVHGAAKSRTQLSDCHTHWSVATVFFLLKNPLSQGGCHSFQGPRWLVLLLLET